MQTVTIKRFIYERFLSDVGRFNLMISEILNNKVDTKPIIFVSLNQRKELPKRTTL